MKNPLIGTTARGFLEESPNSVPESYLRALNKAGAVSVMLPSLDQRDLISILKVLDGLVGIGGGDIDPEFYKKDDNCTCHPATYGVDSERDESESQLIRYAIEEGIPSLFICRTMQLANVVSGGDLIFDIPDDFGKAVSHRLDLPCRKFHPVEHKVEILEPDSLLGKIVQKNELSVVSCHHQAVKTVAPDWRVVATAPDGVIEAIEHIYHPFCLGVQWHPELSVNDPTNQRLFESLVNAASIRRKVMQD